MGILIDTSVLIAIERGQLDLDSLLAKQAEEDIALAAVTASELLHGVHRAGKAAHRARREAFVEHLLARLTVIPFDLVVARIHARIWARLAAKGVTVGAHDLLIAPTALASDFRVATRDERSFSRIPGLSIVRW